MSNPSSRASSPTGGRGVDTGKGKGKKKHIGSVLRPSPAPGTAEVSDGASVRAINVLEFAEARAREIQAMAQAISGTGGGNRRVFQTLPRNMRRRAMSHNIRRLPVRLRMAAAREVENEPPHEPGAKTKRSRRHRRLPGNLLLEYARRQRRHLWLETHIWHAKRMHMVATWGYRLAARPTERGGRATYRATTSHCTAHDASYTAAIQLHGPVARLASTLMHVADPTDMPPLWAAMYRTGSHSTTCMLYACAAYPRGALGPALAVWDPPEAGQEHRRVWLFVSPGCRDEALQALTLAATQAGGGVTATLLQHEIVRFSLAGPQATAVLQAVLRPPDTTTVGAQVWARLRHLHHTGCLPPGCVLGMHVYDPRIAFPPDTVRRDQRGQDRVNATASTESQQHQAQLLRAWPEGASRSGLWDPACRQAARDAQLSQRVLNDRRAQHAVRKGMQAQAGDATVPLMLLQVPGTQKGYGAGWELLLPRGWGMAFWVALTHAGAKPTGLQEQHRLHTEQGRPHYPHDMPDTPAGQAHAEATAAQLQARHQRQPPAKRPNHAVLGVAQPFSAPWPLLLAHWAAQAGLQTDGLGCYVVRGHRGLQACASLLAVASEAVLGAAQTRVQRLADKTARLIETSPLRTDPIYKNMPGAALVCVTVHMLGRGTPTYNAMLCLPTEDDYRRYLANPKHYNGPTEPRPCPQAQSGGSSRAVAGYVTTGGYMLGQARGGAVACVALLALEHWAITRDPRCRGFVLVRNTSSSQFRPAVLRVCTP